MAMQVDDDRRAGKLGGFGDEGFVVHDGTNQRVQLCAGKSR